MKHVFLIACLLISAGTVFSQGKEKKGDDEFVFDKKAGTVKDLSGNLLYNIDYVKSVTVIGNDYYFKNKDGKMLMVFKFVTYKDPRLVSQANPQGNQNYYEIKFFTEPVMESECQNMFLKGLVKLVQNKQLVTDGALNIEKVKEFVVINGNTFSRRRAELSRY